MKITLQDVYDAQDAWRQALLKTNEYTKSENFEDIAKRVIQRLYGFGERDILFKPTRAVEVPFRSKLDEAVSYFIGGHIREDVGFALSNFQDMQYDNYQVITNENEAFAIGKYTFVHPDGSTIVAEYTIGYYLNEHGLVKIFLHHSSFPYQIKK